MIFDQYVLTFLPTSDTDEPLPNGRGADLILTHAGRFYLFDSLLTFGHERFECVLFLQKRTFRFVH